MDHLRETITNIHNSINKDTEFNIARVQASHEKKTNEQLQTIHELLSSLRQKTSEFEHKVPNIESTLSTYIFLLS